MNPWTLHPEVVTYAARLARVAWRRLNCHHATGTLGEAISSDVCYPLYEELCRRNLVRRGELAPEIRAYYAAALDRMTAWPASPGPEGVREFHFWMRERKNFRARERRARGECRMDPMPWVYVLQEA